MDGAIYGKGFAAAYDECFSSWGPTTWPALRREVRRACPRASTWLDLCCGGGSLLKIVAAQGFTAVGIDNSPHQLRYARRNVPSATILRADIRTLSLGRTFDVITCMYDSLNYLLAPRDLERAVQNARRHLAPGGIFAFDMNTFEGLRDRWRQVSMIRGKLTITIIQSSFDGDQAIGRCLITVFLKQGRYWRKFEEEHLERGYRPTEIEGLLARSGFAFRKYDGHTFRRPGKRPGRLLYICHENRLRSP